MELDLRPPLVSAEVLATFQSALDRRAGFRRKKVRDEKRMLRKAQNEAMRKQGKCMEKFSLVCVCVCVYVCVFCLILEILWCKDKFFVCDIIKLLYSFNFNLTYFPFSSINRYSYNRFIKPMFFSFF